MGCTPVCACFLAAHQIARIGQGNLDHQWGAVAGFDRNGALRTNRSLEQPVGFDGLGSVLAGSSDVSGTFGRYLVFPLTGYGIVAPVA